MLAVLALLITLVPHVIFAGGSIWLTCTVPHDVRNRRLSYGIEDYTQSERMLDGDRAAITWRVLIDHLPPEATTAFCRVTREDGSITTVTSRFAVLE
jgi:hypothetical protein